MNKAISLQIESKFLGCEGKMGEGGFNKILMI
jgi:hypothetical protein